MSAELVVIWTASDYAEAQAYAAEFPTERAYLAPVISLDDRRVR